MELFEESSLPEPSTLPPPERGSRASSPERGSRASSGSSSGKLEETIEIWIVRDADGSLGLDIDEAPSGAPIITGFAPDMAGFVNVNDVIYRLHGHRVRTIEDLVSVLRMPEVAQANRLQLHLSRPIIELSLIHI